jgi:hypothetical protein
MKYSVNVTGNAVYTIEARVACPLLGKSFRIEMDGVTIATVNVPLTGSSQAWQTVTITGVNLTAGEKIMRIYSTKGGYNINYIKFTATTPLTVLRSSESAGTSVTTFPLPFSTSFTVNIFGETTGEYNLTLADLSGNTVWRKTVTKEKETLTENIYMGNLQNGIYILQVVTPDQKQVTHKLIKN